jgi:hypothetical protein
MKLWEVVSNSKRMDGIASVRKIGHSWEARGIVSSLTKGSFAFIMFNFLFQAPKPSNVVSVLATKCYDRGSKLHRDKWFVPRGPQKCEELRDLSPTDEIIVNNSITEKQVVFSFWIPGPRDGAERKMSPLFQSMLGVLQIDIEHSLKVPLSKRYYGSNCSGSVVSICCLKS